MAEPVKHRISTQLLSVDGRIAYYYNTTYKIYSACAWQYLCRL